MKLSTLFLAVAPFSLLTRASPTPQALSQDATTLLASLQAVLAGTLTGIDGALQASNFDAVLQYLQNVVPLTTGPTSPEDAIAQLQLINSTLPANLFDYIANLEALNLVDSVADLLQFVQGVQTGMNSMNNVNADPPTPVYPQKCSCDAPYSVDEASLRGAIYIPDGFTYGAKPPVILFPGTGSTGYFTFIGNYIPLLTDVDYADPVWVNVPGYLLDDAQTNAEYAAYAVNYISTLTGTNVTIVAWSQGNLDSQWAYKYWPCTRLVVSDHIAISADYDGTIFANFISPPGAPLPPSILQQRYQGTSMFIDTLHTYDGDSAYVPTTSVYSSFFDEIVQPQQGTGASAFINDVRNVGTSNSEVQVVCALQPAGTFYTHESLLGNPLGFALFQDAMANPGAGQPADLDLTTVCSTYLTPGLTLGDLLLTENSIVIAGLAILLYTPKVTVEPAIMPYALQPPVTDLAQCTLVATSTTTTTTSTGFTSTLTTSTSTTTTTSTSFTSTLTTSTSATTTTSINFLTTTTTTDSSVTSSSTSDVSTSSTTSTVSTSIGLTTSSASTSSSPTTSTTVTTTSTASSSSLNTDSGISISSTSSASTTITTSSVIVSATSISQSTSLSSTVAVGSPIPGTSTTANSVSISTSTSFTASTSASTPAATLVAPTTSTGATTTSPYILSTSSISSSISSRSILSSTTSNINLSSASLSTSSAISTKPGLTSSATYTSQTTTKSTFNTLTSIAAGPTSGASYGWEVWNSVETNIADPSAITITTSSLSWSAWISTSSGHIINPSVVSKLDSNWEQWATTASESIDPQVTASSGLAWSDWENKATRSNKHNPHATISPSSGISHTLWSGAATASDADDLKWAEWSSTTDIIVKSRPTATGASSSEFAWSKPSAPNTVGIDNGRGNTKTTSAVTSSVPVDSTWAAWSKSTSSSPSSPPVATETVIPAQAGVNTVSTDNTTTKTMAVGGTVIGTAGWNNVSSSSVVKPYTGSASAVSISFISIFGILVMSLMNMLML